MNWRRVATALAVLVGLALVVFLAFAPQEFEGGPAVIDNTVRG